MNFDFAVRFVTAILTAVLLAMCLPRLSPAADLSPHQGMHGAGHDKWHEQFYKGLMRKDTKTSCCNLSDCRPTEVRRGDNGQYQVLLDGEWTDVPQISIQNVTAPDQGAHVCAPKQPSSYAQKGTIWCVVLPPEG